MVSLHQSTVLITSRPVASANLLHIADRRVEILVFTQRQIHEYIEKALKGNSKQIQKLFQHLKEHPVIEGYCYIPLHVAILVHIFLTMKGALPTTLHELFLDLVLCCIVREQETHERNTNLPEISSLDDLPDDVKVKLSDICQLAYNGVMENKVVFYSKYLDLSSLGLIQAVKGLTLTSRCCSYNFLHLSVQELLAAYFISQMDPSEQVRVFEKLFESPRLQPVLRYYSGFTKLVNPRIRKFISSFQHGKANIKALLPLLHCFFEAHEPSLCQIIRPTLATNINLKISGNPSDYLAIGYFITSLLSTSSPDKQPVKLSCSIYDNDDLHCLKLLVNELTKYPLGEQPTATCALPRKLIFQLTNRKKYVPCTPLQMIADHLKLSPAIKEFVLYRGEDRLFHIVQALQTNTSLTKVSLVGLCPPYTDDDCSGFVEMLLVNKSLKHLHLSENLKTPILRCILEGLRHNSTLTHLILPSNIFFLVDDTAKSFTTMLQLNKSLIHLDLSYNGLFADSGACCIFEGLRYNTSLVYLNLRCTGIKATDPNTAMSLIKMLQVNKSLTHLNLSYNEFPDSVCHSIVEALLCNTSNLVELNLSDSKICTKMFKRTRYVSKCSIIY